MDVDAIDAGVRGVQFEGECFVGVAGEEGFRSGEGKRGEENDEGEDLGAD